MSPWRRVLRIEPAFRWGLALLSAAWLAGCGGSSGNAGSTACSSGCVTPASILTPDDVRKVLAQAVGEAQARGAKATIAVTDRVGNVLAVYQMTGAREKFDISSGRHEGFAGGLDGLADTLPSTLAAIAKAVTGAYLSSEGNAFSTRTASQIVQENFNPGESQQPSGPLYGVQFSQLSCSDVIRNSAAHGSVGPKRSPLGLSADPGGLPLYKGGTVVGGIGVMADGLYGLDLDISDIDQDLDELIAVAGTSGFAAPTDIRGDHITADGRTFRYVDSESLKSDPTKAPALATLPGALVAVDGYTPASVGTGTAFGTPASGIRPDTGVFATIGGYVLVDAANNNRFPPRDATEGPLRASDVQTILTEGYKIAIRARGQIRRPLGSFAQVSLSVVDTNGDLLGFVRTPDAPVFGIDVAVQKGRSVLFFSHPLGGAELLAVPPAIYLAEAPPGRTVTSSIGDYVGAMRTFFGDSTQLTGKVAWAARGIGNIHRPTFPDGIADTPAGPLSKSFDTWSPFNVGLQLDLVYNQLVKAAAAGDTTEGCSGRASLLAPAGTPDGGIRRLRNGLQIFAGGVPIYRNGVLAGAVGISGDGIDQDDMIAFLGLANAGRILNNGIGNAPAAMRDDNLAPMGTRLRYVQCPQAPFNDSSEQNVCAGI
jgi:uncharacterized protein GlcG (DUF336 family)